jgi:hypothetical protein
MIPIIIAGITGNPAVSALSTPTAAYQGNEKEAM